MDKRKCKIVFGNGQDLYCGLKSKYGHFFESYENFKTIEAWKKYIESKIYEYDKNSQEDNIRLMTKGKEYYEQFINSKNLSYENYFKDKNINLWDCLFYFSQQRFEYWKDIERFILNFIKNYAEKLFKAIVENSKVSSSNDESIPFPTNFEIGDYWMVPAYIFLYVQYKNETIKAGTAEFKKEINKNDFSNKLLIELEKFECNFGKYINNEFLKNKKTYLHKVKDLLKIMCPNMTIDSIDSFNYTPLEEDDTITFDTLKLKETIHHINGNYKKPIFGIDYDFSYTNERYIFTKTYRRITYDSYKEYEEASKSRKNCFDDLIIFGHSFNGQDYNYYFPLFDYMDLMDLTSDKSFILYLNKELNGEENNKIVADFCYMLQEYDKYKYNRSTTENRIVDFLSSQQRIKIIKIGSENHIGKYNGKYGEYGEYPQSLVKDTELISKLDTITITDSNGYIEYNGEKYYKYSGDEYYNDEGNKVPKGYHYYKVEPIKWKILSNDDNTILVLSEYLIDCQPYGKRYENKQSKTDYQGSTAHVYANNYKYSEIRTWLNTRFYNTAFYKDKSLIKTTLVDNSVSSTGYEENKYACEDTNDNVFLLSVSDYNNAKYGFMNDNSREAKTTEFARARGVWYGAKKENENYLNGLYWTRSPDPCISNFAFYVISDGDLRLFFCNVYFDIIGVRPALTLSLGEK